jgi:pseudaminic acid cytidylyltransferase
MANLAIIPARGGSKRIPGKNIRDFLGKPIIGYSIKAALDCGLFDEVMVSTDSEEIAEIAVRLGAHVPFYRSHQASDDFATTISVVKEVINSFRIIGEEFAKLCCIYPTAPFVTPSRLCQAYNILVENDCDSVFPIVPFSYPVLRGLRIERGLIRSVWPEFKITRSQDLESYFHDAGQFYMANTDQILVQNAMWTDNSYPIILTELEVQDIDNEVDWKIAELKYSLTIKN